MNRDFVEMSSALSAENVEFLVVGAHALAAHGYPRATGALDIWVRPSTDNASRVRRGLAKFGARLGGTRPEDFAAPGVIFQMGVVPCLVDVITEIDGVSFEDARPRRVVQMLGGIAIPVIGLEDLRRNKRASGRPKDLADLAWLDSRDP